MSDLPGYPMSNFTSSQLPNNHDANVHASVLLRTLIAEAPAEAFTLGWLIGNLRQRSFGALILVLAIVALVPVGISIPAGLLIAFLAVQVILGYRNAILPNHLMMRPLPSRYLWLIKDYIIPLLIHLETAVRPRWPAFVGRMLRVAGVAVLLLAVILLTLPLPLVNIPIAGAIVLIALAQTEQDGLLLVFALAAAAVVFALALVAVLGLVDGAEWIFRVRH